ncbi:hypothetical protein HMPREF2734_01325 [Corynebacterium sp. HMSC055D05]|nr:hypothetical protein HMPREF2734_01325 [Corynebacterium sp. HMSC055D05]
MASQMNFLLMKICLLTLSLRMPLLKRLVNSISTCTEICMGWRRALSHLQTYMGLGRTLTGKQAL